VVDTYVINMDDHPERYRNFLTHFSHLCGVNPGRLHRHSGVVATNAMYYTPWAKELIPGLKKNSSVRAGSLGLSLAHLTAWVKIKQSQGCTENVDGDAYALIFEDDERPKQHFVEAVSQIVRIASSRPEGERPDFINLNVLRPHGDMVALLEEMPIRVKLLRVKKAKRKWRTGPLDKVSGLHYNVWMSAYLVRCGAAQDLIQYGGRYPDGAHIYDGVTPTFDRQMADTLSDGDNPLKAWVVAPTDVVSYHREGFDSRKQRDAEAAKSTGTAVRGGAAAAQEEAEELWEGFEWH